VQAAVALPFRRLSSWWRRLARDPWSDRVDWQYDADTGGTIQMGELDIDSPNVAHANCYRGTLGWVIRLFLERLPIDHRDFAFVDYGSGKGRALLVASEFAFPAIVGIEFCAELHEIALRNLANLPDERRGRIQALLQDATTYDLPDADVVCYLYNPFRPPLLDAVIARLAAHGRAGHRVFAVYINPKHRDSFERGGLFEPIFEHKKGVTYRFRG
jgi:SAM-dependent methyltransferase